MYLRNWVLRSLLLLGNNEFNLLCCGMQIMLLLDYCAINNVSHARKGPM